MSQTTEINPVAASVLGGLEMGTSLLCKDLAATPDERLTWTPTETCRPIASLVAELVAFNNCAIEAIQTAAPTWTDVDAPTTSAEAVTMIQNSVAALKDAVMNCTDWDTKFMAPWQMETSKADFANIAVMHMNYHDGQICFIQTAYGDKDMHWM